MVGAMCTQAVLIENEKLKTRVHSPSTAVIVVNKTIQTISQLKNPHREKVLMTMNDWRYSFSIRLKQ